MSGLRVFHYANASTSQPLKTPPPQPAQLSFPLLLILNRKLFQSLYWKRGNHKPHCTSDVMCLPAMSGKRLILIRTMFLCFYVKVVLSVCPIMAVKSIFSLLRVAEM